MLLVAIYMLFGFLHGTQEKVGDDTGGGGPGLNPCGIDIK